MGREKRVIFIFVFIVLFFSAETTYPQPLFYKEINIIGGYSDRDKWIDKNSMMASSLGFEYYQKFSSEYGDYLTANLQTRVSYDSSANSRNAWGVELHNAWFEYKLLPWAKIKTGHLDCPFSLEPVVDTHGTLLQTLAEDNIGFKQDWGTELRGSLPYFDYEAALQLGSGMSIRRKDGSFLASTRIGTPAGQNLQAGYSLLYGKVLETEGMRTLPRNRLLSSESVTKKRLGVDGQYLYGPCFFKGEAAYGRDEKKDVLGYLAEIDYTLPKYQNWQFELQFKSWINDLDSHSSHDTTLTVGTSYKLSQSVTLRAAYFHDFNLMDGKEEDKFLVQFYFFGA